MECLIYCSTQVCFHFNSENKKTVSVFSLFLYFWDSTMPWMFLDWFVPVYLLVSVLVLAGFGACLYFLEPGLQDAHKWSNKSLRHQPLAPTRQTHCRDDDSNALLWWDMCGRSNEPFVPNHPLMPLYQNHRVFFSYMQWSAINVQSKMVK